MVRRGWGAGPWNKSIPNGRETDGWTDGKKAACQASAILHRLILCCAPVHVFVLRLRLQFQFAFYTVLLYRAVVFPPRFLVGLDAITPCLRAPVILHTSATPTEIFA